MKGRKGGAGARSPEGAAASPAQAPEPAGLRPAARQGVPEQVPSGPPTSWSQGGGDPSVLAPRPEECADTPEPVPGPAATEDGGAAAWRDAVASFRGAVEQELGRLEARLLAQAGAGGAAAAKPLRGRRAEAEPPGGGRWGAARKRKKSSERKAPRTRLQGEDAPAPAATELGRSLLAREEPAGGEANRGPASKAAGRTLTLGEIGETAFSALEARLRALNVTSKSEDEDVTTSEWLTYEMEKYMSGSKMALFRPLVWVAGTLMVLLALLWWSCQKFDDPGTREEQPVRRLKGSNSMGDYEISLWYAMFVSYQVILSAGFNDSIDGVTRQMIYCAMILVGLTVFGVLVGMITEAFEDVVHTIRDGHLKAVESGHTVVLGWNEGTVRLVCQLAFLRRQWQRMNETWLRYYFWWLRVPPSTPVAKGSIVVLCNTMTKAEMEEAISQGFGERGISRARTRLGRDVICRVGDPSNVQDLQRVGVHRANAVVSQLVQADQEPEVRAVTCGMTLRALMALRFALYISRKQPPWETLRIVVEMNQSAQVVDAAHFTAPHSDRKIVHAQDLTLFLNSLIFKCVGQAGLAQVKLQLMSFEGASIKFRRASDIRGGEGLVGRTVRDVGLSWEDAVLLGARADGTAMQGVSGILVDPAWKIQASDTLIFLCESSMPKPAEALGDLERVDAEEDDATVDPRRRRLSRAATLSGNLMVLICGWKIEWDNPESFLTILDEIASNARQGISVTFMSEDAPDWFQKHMCEVQAADGEGRIVEEPRAEGPSWLLDKVRIVHKRGDAANFQDLLEVLRAQHYHEAIVIPPTARKEMSPLAADTWVISVILALRHNCKELQREDPHVVAENLLDATSKLAVVPSDSQDRPCVPDFVNAVAIKARALCQVIAYPEMSPLLADLFSRDQGTPVLLLVSASAFALEGQTLAFRTVVKRVLRAQPHTDQAGADDVCLGFRTADGTLRMPPRLSEEHTFAEDDKIVIVTRRAPTSDVYESLLTDRDAEASV